MMTFRWFGIPVEIEHGAWLLAGVVFLMGLSQGASIPFLVGGILVGAVSILAHELGHALVARGLGLAPIRIALHGFGGRTTHPWSGSPVKELAITVAGPLFGFGLALAAAVALRMPWPAFVADLIALAVTLNVAWSLFNLLPIFPMDGGRAVGFLLETVLPPPTAWLVVHVLGALLGGLLSLAAIVRGELWIATFAGLFTYQNVEGFQRVRALRRAGDQTGAA